MAWRSSGTNNDEMVDNLKRFGVIYSDAVEEAFRGVDRRFFVPKNFQELAHADQPLKDGHIHISAPHIYGSVVEALELTPNSSLSFLNLGCGTGYLSSIVAHILGPTSRQVGVDIHADVVDHCRASIQEWRSNCGRKVPLMDVIQGNALNIDATKGEAHTGFDRMYVGASVDRRKLPYLVGMLRMGGIFVGPVDDDLVKVVRIANSEEDGEQDDFCNRIPRSFRGHPPSLSANFSMQVISGVRFTPLINNPPIKTIIPSQIWDPTIHQHYPDSFRRSCKELLLCSSARVEQPPPKPLPAYHKNMAATLPRAVWMEILSYTDRTWFEKPPAADENLLRRRLMEEQAAARRSEELRLQAESRLHLIERERDVYRLLAMRWQSRLQSVLRERGSEGEDEAMAGMEDFADVTTSAFANEPLLLRLGSLSALMRHFQDNSSDQEESEGENMEEEEMDAIGGIDDDAEGEDDDMSVTRPESPMSHHRSARTVSISSEGI